MSTTADSFLSSSDLSAKSRRLTTSHLAYAAYVDGVYTSINSGTLRRHVPGPPVVERVDDVEILRFLREEFRADPSLYTEAAAVHAKWVAKAGLVAA